MSISLKHSSKIIIFASVKSALAINILFFSPPLKLLDKLSIT